MTGLKRWTGLEPLALGKTILLEASAGTGKTWQIEGLVVRLVAEYEVSIDRILVITFTNAATAELRDRIRARLVAARDALGRATKPSDDPILERLWTATAERARRQGLLSTALSSFDLAPISTIHGFSQRMLSELAFQSGQEPGLELLTDPKPMLQQLVDDELASAYAAATDEELELLDDMGFARGPLFALAKAMTNAVAPVLEPKPSDGEGSSVTPLAPIRAWLQAKRALRAWLDSPEALACANAVREELERKNKRLDGRRMRRDAVGGGLDAVKTWLAGAACRGSRNGGSGLATAVRNLSLAGLERAWKDDPAALGSFGGYALFARLDALLDEQDRLWPAPLATFAGRARERLERELVRAGVLTYDTMISRLAERVAEQARADGAEGPLARAIRGRFDVALVDEFQDTDGAQWPVLQTVFSHPTRRLIIIGDPKQAIYAFRGADVHVYLDAARVAHVRATMSTNWRSDAAYVAAMNHLWAEGSRAFDLAAVDYVEMTSAPNHGTARIRAAATSRGHAPRHPLELRWVDGTSIGLAERPIGSKQVGGDLTARLAARESARLLAGTTELFVEGADARDAHWRPLEPGDIAVLVRTHGQAERVRRHLERLGIPAVSAGRGSVMRSPVLGWLCAWLDAVAAPGQDRPARALATTPLFGWTAHDLELGLAEADAPPEAARSAEETGSILRWNRWLESIHGWARTWAVRGFVGALEEALDGHDVLCRLLGAKQGERYATDLRHLFELCHAEERRTRLGPSGLASWLRASRASAGDGSDEAEPLRLESDARAVQLVTIHRSKGLEYPVVLLPFAWADFQVADREGPLAWHAALGDRTELRLSLELPGTGNRSEAVRAAELESRQEQTRLLYVALTRARHHAIAWLGPIGTAGADTDNYALGRIALRERDEAGAPLAGSVCPSFPNAAAARKAETVAARAAEAEAAWQEARRRLERLAATSGGTVGWSAESTAESDAPRSLAASSTDRLEARAWPAGRTLITPWQVSSYSAMVAGRTFDPAEPQRLDEIRATAEPLLGEPAAQSDSAGAGAQVELGEPEPSRALVALDTPIATSELVGGTDVGTWVHAVLEELDFQSGTARDGRDLPALVAALGHRHGVRTSRQHELLVTALPALLDTPLDGGATRLRTGFSLRALATADRVDELGFDLRLGDGNDWRYTAGGRRGCLNHEGARVALESRLGDGSWGGDGWLRAVLERASHDEQGVLPRIAGILTGFVDLVFRIGGSRPDRARESRYYVADYKTNRIAASSARRDSHLRHYTQPWLVWEMARHGYHLQALLYTVALHRMLRQRMPHYSYESHVGGHLYLFLRGMTGAGAPRDGGLALGVYADRWPAAVVLGLDAALSGAPTEEVLAIVERARASGARP